MSEELPPIGDFFRPDQAPGEAGLLCTWVPGDPAACRRAADVLHATVSRLDALAASLADAARVPDEAFSGRAGDAFDARATALHAAVLRQRGRARLLARGLAALALDLDRATTQMQQARGAASPLTVLPAGIVPPSAGDPPAHRRAWRRALGLVAAARDVERRAQQSWLTLLAASGAPAEPSPSPGTSHPPAPAGPPLGAGGADRPPAAAPGSPTGQPAEATQGTACDPPTPAQLTATTTPPGLYSAVLDAVQVSVTAAPPSVGGDVVGSVDDAGDTADQAGGPPWRCPDLQLLATGHVR